MVQARIELPATGLILMECTRPATSVRSRLIGAETAPAVGGGAELGREPSAACGGPWSAADPCSRSPITSRRAAVTANGMIVAADPGTRPVTRANLSAVLACIVRPT